MTAELAAPFAARLRRALGNATSGASTVDDRDWRHERDVLGDLLEPVSPSPLTAAEARRIIDLLAESDASRSSRMTPSQWAEEIEPLIAGLLTAATS